MLLTAPLQTAAGKGVLGQSAQEIYDIIDKVKTGKDVVEHLVDALQNAGFEVYTVSRFVGTDGAGVTVVLVWNMSNGKYIASFSGKMGTDLKAPRKKPLGDFAFVVTGTVQLKHRGWGIFGFDYLALKNGTRNFPQFSVPSN